MTRGTRTGGDPRRAGHRKPGGPERSKRPKAADSNKFSAAGEETEVARLRRELNEALAQQTATVKVLQAISSSTGELDPVFETILNNAVGICDARFGNLALFEGDEIHLAASHNAPKEFARGRPKGTIIPASISPLGTVLRTKKKLHVADLAREKQYAESLLVKLAGARSMLAVPMTKGNELIGAINIYRQEVRPFTSKQIELLENFAAQAVIAIENTRLLNELRQRTDDLSESLEQQTATSEVLRVISGTPGDLHPVFETMLENALRICEAKFGTVFHFDGKMFQFAAEVGTPPAFAEFVKSRGPFYPVKGSHLERVLQTKQVSHTADYAAEGVPSPPVKLGGARSTVDVPMLKDGEMIGAFSIYRQEVRPFSEKQIALLQNFAAQAVIAIENARLLSELRQRTGDLSESLEQQTATSDVLRVISRSTGELEPVFETMLRNATRICEAAFGSMLLKEGDTFRRVAIHNAPPMFSEFHKRTPVVNPRQIHDLKRLIETKEPVHIADAAAGSVDSPIVKYAGARTLLVVPMLKDDELVGAIGIYRQEVRPFTSKQIQLVSSFAAQAVIAIENARLLNELRQRTDDLSESLEQQTATSEILKVISSSPGDLNPVFDAILEKATNICEAQFGLMYSYDGKLFHNAAMRDAPAALVEFHRYRGSFLPPPGTTLDRLLKTKDVIHCSDDSATPIPSAPTRLAGAKAILAVPMFNDDALVGAIVIYRQEVRPFTEKQIELVRNFAAQAVIAIENARLLSELRQRTDDLTASLDNLRTAQDRLVQTEKLASLGQLTAGIAHEIKNPLNFVNNFSAVSVELIDELRQALAGASLDNKLRAEISEIADMLQGNLDRVVQHGKRADSIVKNMLLHSRQGSGEHRPIDVNALVEESLNLAYHGARAEKQGFNIMLEKSFDPAAGEVDLFPQEITRVLLNLISNGFYAATKRKAEIDGGDYEPMLAAATKNLGDRVEITIRDNGTGIPPEVKEKLFNPFFTTKPAGEGTGLGLSISHDIVVKQHGGSIEVDSRPGEFTEFKIILPRTAASLAKSGGRA